METKFTLLHKMIARHLAVFQPLAVKQNSFIVNEVPADFRIMADEKVLSSLVHSMLSSVVAGSRNSCIRVSIKQFGNIILLKFRDRSGEIVFDMHCGQNKINVISLAEKIGGSVFMNDSRKKTDMLTLSFPNRLVA